MASYDADPTRAESHFGAKYYHTGEAPLRNPVTNLHLPHPHSHSHDDAGPSHSHHSHHHRAQSDAGAHAAPAGPSYRRSSEITSATNNSNLSDLVDTQQTDQMWHAQHCAVAGGTRSATDTPPSASPSSYTTPRKGSTASGLGLSRTISRGVSRSMTSSDPRFTPECTVCDRIRSAEDDDRRKKEHTPRGQNWGRMMENSGRKREIPTGWWYRMWH